MFYLTIITHFENYLCETMIHSIHGLSYMYIYIYMYFFIQVQLEKVLYALNAEQHSSF